MDAALNRGSSGDQNGSPDRRYDDEPASVVALLVHQSSKPEEAVEHRMQSEPRQALLTEEIPETFHYAAAVVCLLAYNDPWTRLKFLFASAAIAYLQFATSLILLFSYGNVKMPCTDSSECGGGKWCTTSGVNGVLQSDYWSRFGASRCLECDAAPMRCNLQGPLNSSKPWTTEELIEVYAPGARLTPADVVEMCTACLKVLGGVPTFVLSEPPMSPVPSPVNMTWITLPSLNIIGMTWRQWLALVLVAVVAALNVARKSRDTVKTLLYLNMLHWYRNDERYQEYRAPTDASCEGEGGGHRE